MIENASRQLILILAVTALAVLSAIFFKPRFGADLNGGVLLTVEVPEDVLIKLEKDAEENGQSVDRQTVMKETISIINERLDPNGVLDAVIAPRGDTGILIELPYMEGATLDDVIKRIESLGKLEMRMLAIDSRNNEPTEEGTPRTFNLTEEERRLNAWLGQQDNRAKVTENPREVDLFNSLTAIEGGRVSQQGVRWYYHQRKREEDRNGVRWSYDINIPHAINLYDETVVTAGPDAEGAPERLVQLAPVNMWDGVFTGEMLNPAGVRAGTDHRTGKPAVLYQLKSDFETEYADWSGDHIDERSAIILNGEIKSSPSFNGRIPGSGQIAGSFTRAEVDELVRVLKTGSLKVEPEIQAKQVIGPALGKKAVRNGLFSIALGGAIVLAFILFYYRLAGLVAFIGIALNVLFIWGILMMLQATLTLPGIAGIVLTMGMAIDANILIYERIREEIEKGKEMLQACRTGFEKAMVTILDSNITTFIAGVVLYNVGVGPIRGFAVTLMVGIVTTVFTAFFVSRLVFHVMLEKGWLTEFKTAGWFSKFRINFLSKAKYALFLSVILITIGVAAVFVIPRETLLGLDFTGGANLQVVLRDSSTKPDVQERLSADEEFAKAFPNPTVNTVEPDETGASRILNLRLKLNDTQLAEYTAARRQASEAGTDFEPPYVTMLDRILGDDLVENAFSATAVRQPPPGSSSSRMFAEIELHFTEAVNVSELQTALVRGGLTNVRVARTDGGDGNQASDVFVEWSALQETRDTDLFGLVREALDAGTTEEAPLTSVDGKTLTLSNPFPEAVEIGGRMVGELRNAAIGALLLALALIVFYIRIRFHEYKYGIAAVIALTHDVIVSFGILAFANYLGLVSAEINLAMIAAFLTIIGYSINDTIVIFDRIRENLAEQVRLGDAEPYEALINRSINQTFSRTILTSSTTLFVVLAQFVVNYDSGSALESFSFALIIGVLSGTYSTIFVASPIVVWMRNRELAKGGGTPPAVDTSSTPSVGEPKITVTTP